MSVWQSVKGWFGLAPAPVDQPIGRMSNVIGVSQTTARPVTYDAAMTVGSVFAAIRLLSESIANLPINMYELQADGSRKQITDHALIKLLRFKPNYRQTRNEFFEQLALNLVSSGNAYILKDSLGGVLTSLIVINSGSIQPDLNRSGEIIYQWSKSVGQKVELSSDKIWHIKLLGNGLIGMSPLSAAAKQIGIALAADDKVTDLITKNTPTGSLDVPSIWPDAGQREALRSEIKKMIEQDAIPVLGGGSKFSPFSFTAEDIELMATRRFALEDIARIFNVPSVLLNDTSAATVWGSGIAQIIDGYYKFGLRPYLEKIETSMVVNLLPRSDWGKYEIEFDVDAILRANKKDRVEMGSKEVNGGLITLNEYRRGEGLPPVKNGDVIRVAVNLTTLDLIGKIVPAQSKNEGMQ